MLSLHSSKYDDDGGVRYLLDTASSSESFVNIALSKIVRVASIIIERNEWKISSIRST